MTFAFWMILVAAVLPYVTVAIAKANAPDFNNADVRGWTAGLTGWRKRAMQAHFNHFEAFAPFAAGVIVATLSRANPAAINALAGGFIVLRIVYTAVFIQGLPPLRSTVWLGGFLCTIALFAIGAFA